MPGGDGTGPAGMGPMTGRGAGLCAGYTVPAFEGYMGGRSGRGTGGGRGARRMFCCTGAQLFQSGQVYDGKAALKNREEFLEAQLKQIKNRLKGFDEE